MIAAWLLLLLEGGATYGYRLGRELDRHGLKIEASNMYRTLRKLESDGWVESRWMNAAAGPQRRFYRLTARGRRSLDEIAGLIRDVRETHDTFPSADEGSRRRDQPAVRDASSAPRLRDSAA